MPSLDEQRGLAIGATKMQVFHANEPLPGEVTLSLFLAGPTPRQRRPVPSWRDEALTTLREEGFEGQVFVPEPRDGKWLENYDQGIEWEEEALNRADRILVWLPREMETLPGLTTNDEWGFWKGRDPSRLVLGAPAGAAHIRYQELYARKLGVPLFSTLKDTCRAAIQRPVSKSDTIADPDRGEIRRGGECQVPLHIWRTPSFQEWYRAQTAAGNVLESARVEWVFRIPNGDVFSWAMRVKIFVTVENRRKENEVIISRPDLSSVVLYRPKSDLLDTEVVLIREFRSTGRTSDGFIWEVPGGSSVKAGSDPITSARDEVKKEVGLSIAPTAIRSHGARQIAGTFSTHQVHVFSVELTDAEMNSLRVHESENTVFGEAAETELTYIRVRNVRQILGDTLSDWGTVGMILGVLRERL